MNTWDQPDWLAEMPYDASAASVVLINPRVESLDLQHASHGYESKPNLMKVEAGEPCRICGRGAGTAYLCRQCVEAWEVHLGNVPSLLEDLNLAAQRRVRFGGREGNAVSATGSGYDPTNSQSVQPRHLHVRHPSHTSPPMPDLHAADIIGELRNELVGQVRAMCETFDLEVPALGSDAAGMSRWLLTQADRLRWMDDADGLVRDLDHAMRRGVQAIDAPKRPQYVSACTSCGLAVWADPGAVVVTCACGQAYDVEATRAKRMLTAHDYLVTVQEAHLLSKVPRATIDSWIRRGRIAVRGTRRIDVEVRSQGGLTVKRPQSVHILRYGDVVNLADTDTAREA